MRLRLLCCYVWSLLDLGKGSSSLWVHSLKYLGKGSFCQILLQIIIRLNTLVDVIRVPKVRTSGEKLPIDTFCKHPPTCLCLESTIPR